MQQNTENWVPFEEQSKYFFKVSISCEININTKNKVLKRSGDRYVKWYSISNKSIIFYCVPCLKKTNKNTKKTTNALMCSVSSRKSLNRGRSFRGLNFLSKTVENPPVIYLQLSPDPVVLRRRESRAAVVTATGLFSSSSSGEKPLPGFRSEWFYITQITSDLTHAKSSYFEGENNKFPIKPHGVFPLGKFSATFSTNILLKKSNNEENNIFFRGTGRLV